MRIRASFVVLAILLVVPLAACSAHKCDSSTCQGGPTASPSSLTHGEDIFATTLDDIKKALPSITFGDIESQPRRISGMASFKNDGRGGFTLYYYEGKPTWNGHMLGNESKVTIAGLEAAIAPPTGTSASAALVHRMIGTKEYLAFFSIEWPEDLDGKDQALETTALILANRLNQI